MVAKSEHVLNPLIHAPVRLQIMAMLKEGPPDMLIEFTKLRGTLMISDGNLGTHISSLEGAGYIEVTKDFISRRPRTRIGATEAGRDAFMTYLRALQTILKNQFMPFYEADEGVV